MLRADEAWPQTRFLDVGAVVLHLRAVSWQVPDFDVVRHRPQLLEIDRIIRTDGAFTVTDHRLLLHAVRPPAVSASAGGCRRTDALYHDLGPRLRRGCPQVAG